MLLDTHALLWWANDSRQLGAAVRLQIADAANEVLVSSASPWEIAIKSGLGKLDVDPVALMAAVEARSLLLLQPTATHLSRLMKLDRIHNDPFDRLIVAQAICEDAVIVTDDREVARYPVRTMPCR